MFGPHHINQEIQDKEGAVLDIENKGNIEGYLGIMVDRIEEKIINIYQTQNFQDIINQVNLTPNNKTRHITFFATKIINLHTTFP